MQTALFDISAPPVTAPRARPRRAPRARTCAPTQHDVLDLLRMLEAPARPALPPLAARTLARRRADHDVICAGMAPLTAADRWAVRCYQAAPAHVKQWVRMTCIECGTGERVTAADARAALAAGLGGQS